MEETKAVLWLAELLQQHGACGAGASWAAGLTPAQAWAECDRPDWMMWIAARRVSRAQLVLAACACARSILHLVPDGVTEPRVAIEAAEGWARGEVSASNVHAAQVSAWGAADNARKTSWYYAAVAASHAATCAVWDLVDAPMIAEDAAYYAAARDGGATLSRRREVCDVIRGVITAKDVFG